MLLGLRRTKTKFWLGSRSSQQLKSPKHPLPKHSRELVTGVSRGHPKSVRVWYRKSIIIDLSILLISDTATQKSDTALQKVESGGVTREVEARMTTVEDFNNIDLLTSKSSTEKCDTVAEPSKPTEFERLRDRFG